MPTNEITTTLPLNVGFAIGTGAEDVISDNFLEKFGRDATDTDWATLHEDISRIERNAINFLRRKLGAKRDEGQEYVHGYYEDWHPHALDVETAEALIKGTSSLASVLDLEISFFNIDPPNDMERLDAIISSQKGTNAAPEEVRAAMSAHIEHGDEGEGDENDTT